MSFGRIRQASQEELEEIWRLACETAWETLPEADKTAFSRDTVLAHASRLVQSLLTQPANVVFVAEGRDGWRVGHLWLGESQDQLTGEVVAWVHDMMVEPEFRREGIATRLLEHGQDYARAKGYSHLGLTVVAGNYPARRLYESMGFGEENIVMRKAL